jgi:hypothetical protein
LTSFGKTVSISGRNSTSDFDFLVGHWKVHHRRLRERLANSHDWIEFDGTSVAEILMGGLANLDDNLLEFSERAYRAVTLRSFVPMGASILKRQRDWLGSELGDGILANTLNP